MSVVGYTNGVVTGTRVGNSMPPLLACRLVADLLGVQLPPDAGGLAQMLRVPHDCSDVRSRYDALPAAVRALVLPPCLQCGPHMTKASS